MSTKCALREDPLALLNALFRGGPQPPCPDAADSDDDGSLGVTDAIYTLGWLFLAGPEFPGPGARACGPDETSDGLEGCSYDPSLCPGAGAEDQEVDK